jgi:hypothetical protein
LLILFLLLLLFYDDDVLLFCCFADVPVLFSCPVYIAGLAFGDGGVVVYAHV